MSATRAPVPLAEAKAEARALEQATRTHRRDCSVCYTVNGRLMACDEFRTMRAELRGLRAAIRSWFAPSPRSRDVAMTPAAAAGSPADPPPAGEPTAAAAGPKWEHELQRAAAALERNRRRINAGESYAGHPARTWRRKPGRRGDRYR